MRSSSALLSSSLTSSELRKASGSVIQEASTGTINELLKREQEQLEELESHLNRSKEITSQMFTLLDNFQDRLTLLENDILPVYASTTKTRGLFNNIDGVIKEVTNISSLLNTSNRVDKLISNGPRGDFEQYGNCLKEIGRAKKYLRLQGSSFKAAPTAFEQLDKLEYTGQLKCDDALVNLISKCSVPKEPTEILSKIKKSDWPDPPKGKISIAKDKRKELQILAEALQQYPQQHFKWGNTYISKRRAFVLQSLQKLKTSQFLNEHLSEKKRKAGSMHPFMRLFSCFVPMIEGEKLLARKIFGKSFAVVFCSVCESSVDYFIETGETLIKLYQGLSVFMRAPLLDVLVYLREHFDRISSVMEVMEALKLLTDIDTFLNRMEDKIKVSFNQVGGEIRGSHFAIRDSGTVDQLTSNVLSFLASISLRKDLVVRLLYSKEETKEGDPFGKYVQRILNDLISAILQKASDEKNINLKAIYTLNNIQHIVSKVKTSNLNNLVEKLFFDRCEKEIRVYSTMYKTTWNKCISLLMDQSMKKGKSDKHLKQQIQNFNQEFEQMFRNQQQYVIPNKELKAQIISELKAVLEPCYEAFYDRVKQTSLSTDNSLMKYPPKVLSGMLEKMFVGIAAPDSPRGKKKLLSKLKV